MGDINIFSGKKIKNVDFVFENCEVYTVPIDGIYRMSVNNIHFSFHVHVNGLNEWEEPGETMCSAYADNIGLILNKKGMEVESGWKEMFKEGEGCPLAERIKYNDITHFDFNFTDGTNFYLGVNWEDGENEFVNKYQHNDIREDFAFIDIYEEYNEEEEKEMNDSYYEFLTFSDDNETEKISFNVPNYIIAALTLIRKRLNIAMLNRMQEEYESPFDNTGNKFNCPVFEVEAYNWNEDEDQEYNFKWKDYKIRWYKYFDRGIEANRYMSPQECSLMLDEIMKYLSKMDMEEEETI